MPAVVVVTEVFANLARTAARARGYESLRTLVLPHPMETRSRDEIRAIANEKLGQIKRLLADSGSASNALRSDSDREPGT